VALRTRHLACLFLLFSTMGAAQASASPARGGFYGDHIAALLYRHAIDARSERLGQKTTANSADPETLELSAPCRAALRSTWTMRPPAAHSASLAAATSFARATVL
jgi:hypothetical protein